MGRLAWLIVALMSTATATAARDAASLRAADAAQHAAARDSDADALGAMALPEFRLHAPEGYIGNRERLIARFRARETGYTRFERTIGDIAITGDVGIVMGREIVQAAAGTAVGRRLGTDRAVARRFTNVWLWQGDRWRWLARHANEVGPGDTP